MLVEFVDGLSNTWRFACSFFFSYTATVVTAKRTNFEKPDGKKCSQDTGKKRVNNNNLIRMECDIDPAEKMFRIFIIIIIWRQCIGILLWYGMWVLLLMLLLRVMLRFQIILCMQKNACEIIHWIRLNELFRGSEYHMQLYVA